MTENNETLYEVIQDYIRKEIEQMINMQRLLSDSQLSDFQESEEFQT